jgi:hypothetical protein
MMPSISQLIALSRNKADTVEQIGHALIDRAEAVEHGLLPQLTLAEETVSLVWLAYGSALNHPIRNVASYFPDLSVVCAALRRIGVPNAAEDFEKHVEGCLTSEANDVLEALWAYIVEHQYEISLDAEP